MTQNSTPQTPMTQAEIQALITKMRGQIDQLEIALMHAPAEAPTPINWQRAAQLGMTPTLAVRLDLYLAALDRAAVVHYKTQGYNWEPTVHVAEAGNAARKYIRIVSTDHDGGRSVHAFVEKTTGKVVKAAGWAAPAKSMAGATKGELLSKYTLADDSFNDLLELLETQPSQIHGSYLYGAVA